MQWVWWSLGGPWRSLGRHSTAPGASSVAVLEALTVMLYTAFDRRGGVLPLLVAAPGDYVVVLVFRNLNAS